MTDALTAADGIELRSVDKDGRDKMDEYEISRWSKSGDRLYLDDDAKLDKHNVFVDLESNTVEGAPSSSWSTDVAVEGDTATIEVSYGTVRTKTVTFVVALEGEEFDAEDDDQDDEETDADDEAVEQAKRVRARIHKYARAGKHYLAEPEAEDYEGVPGTDDEAEQKLVADGGQPTVDEEFDDAEIEEAIDANAAETDVEEVRDVLRTLQQSVEEVWSTHMDNVEDNAMELVAIDGDILVFADHTNQFWNAEFDDGPLGERDLERGVQVAVSQLHHKWARRHSDYDWSVDDPIVVRKPAGFDAGQRLVEAVMLNLTNRGLSPRQAWAVWGVLAGNSRNNWATRMGYDSHSGVSNAIREAKEKIPLPYL